MRVWRGLFALIAWTSLAVTCPVMAAQTADGDLMVVAASPEKGFNFPYILRLPDSTRPPAAILLVEPNNTGAVSDKLEVHLEAAKQLSEKAIGGYVRKKLNMALLVPVFPRPESAPELYTHLLNRRTMLVADGDLRRLDLQLIKMIEDAKMRLKEHGTPVKEKVFMTGFSASGSFTNRFTLMHPEKVQAVASGGLNGLLMLPVNTLGAARLDYPLGTADLKAISGEKFRRKEWLRVPQFIYMGAIDDNDAVAFDDGYTEQERATVHAVIGKNMQPERWQNCQRIYRQAGANVTFTTYEKVGHWTDGKINQQIVEFFKMHMTK